MKLPTAITVVMLTLAAAFLVYSNRDEQSSPQPLQANINESLPKEPETLEKPEPVAEITSTQGLNEELNSILEGYNEIQNDFDRLEPEKTATEASN